jgi:hypothetical protein
MAVKAFERNEILDGTNGHGGQLEVNTGYSSPVIKHTFTERRTASGGGWVERLSASAFAPSPSESGFSGWLSSTTACSLEKLSLSTTAGKAVGL